MPFCGLFKKKEKKADNQQRKANASTAARPVLASNLEQAERDSRANLEQKMKIKGPNHASTLEAMANLANILDVRNKRKEAMDIRTEMRERVAQQRLPTKKGIRNR